MATSSDNQTDLSRNHLFKIRTITAFVSLKDSDFHHDAVALKSKLETTSRALEMARQQLEGKSSGSGYEIQTLRVATNPFPEYLLGSDSSSKTACDEAVVRERLKVLDDCFEKHGIAFVSLGPACSQETVEVCTRIVDFSGRFSCSVQLASNDVALARVSAETILRNSKLGNPEDGGLANFRFCVANVKPYIPFFPAAKARTEDDETFTIRFAIGLENGALLKDLLEKDAGRTIANILPPKTLSPASGSSFAAGFAESVRPIQSICDNLVREWDGSSAALEYIGLDASFNPSLDEEGSVASAVEALDEVSRGFGGVGTIAATAAMTTAIQTKLPSEEEGFGIKITGYNGLMLPLCEDKRLAQLATEGKLRMTDLLNVSSVCGVGIDTVPIPGDASVEELTSLLLDVAGLAERWNKPLSCRVFPVPNKTVGEMTTFDSPFLVNSKILPVSS
ncbi:unnamed protein product [Pseudo-nitzschia multistriata]|uniref:DUF711 domain-containing protein n=1 Tax=Pseudo-nitzschia multistriata TaxID=183589 RepID=A0A448YY41_9STRA|nr:unnamed protein product [Pseudo-nitzschia multistriata]